MGLGRKKLVLNPHSGRKENNMLSITKTTNLSGTSVINGQSAMTMYAAVPETGSLTISQTITNKELYLANQTQCDNDYENFKSEVNKLLKSEQQTIDSDTINAVGIVTE